MILKKYLIVLLATLLIVSVTSAQDEDSFTIQAAEDLQAPLSALYGAFYDGAEPEFVDDGGDLLATAEPQDMLYPHVLPDVALVTQTDNAAIDDFIAFAISPDGQQVLIDEGFLPDTVTLTDQAGNEVVIPQPVRGVISAHGPSVYFFYGVGAQDRIITANYLGARSPDSPAGAMMTQIDPRFPDIVSTTMTTREVNVEEIALLDPDVVFTSPRSPWIDAVKELGIPVFLYEAETPDRLKEAMRLTGEIFGPNAAAQADAWIAYYDTIVETIATQTADVEDRLKVLFTGTEPLRVASGDMYQTSIIEAAGGNSASAELTGYWNDTNLEQVLLWEPDVILVPGYGGATISAITDSEEWQIIDAAAEERVYQLPSVVAPWDTPAPDSVLAIIWLAETLYPEQVELDCAAEVSYFYDTFYNFTLSDNEINMICGS